MPRDRPNTGLSHDEHMQAVRDALRIGAAVVLAFIILGPLAVILLR